MLLAVDIGNTNVTLGLFRGEELEARWRLSTDIRRTSDEFTMMLLTLLEQDDVSPDQVTAAVIASVVPPLTEVLEAVCQRCFHLTPLIVGPETRTGVRVRIDNPAEVGADRVVNAAAAHRLQGGPLIIIDFGTGTTFDAVSDEGDYLGGTIAPGIELAAEALFQRAAKLPRIELEFPPRVIGTNTVNAMQAGLMYGYVGLVEGIVARMKMELGGSPRVIATGGLAEVMQGHTEVIDAVEPDLTLQGLRMIWELNAE